MWRVLLLPWPDLPEPARAALSAAAEAGLATAGDGGRVVVDERCPGLDAATVRRLVVAAADGRPRVGVRPVSDTVKRVHAGAVTGTVDRAGLLQVASPLVVPAVYVGHLAEGGTMPQLAAALARVTEVVPVEVPAAARPLADPDELALLSLAVGA
jgi:2-C-methyl-D-erythritol 4-phosphate cytidylyltransferase